MSICNRVLKKKMKNWFYAAFEYKQIDTSVICVICKHTWMPNTRQTNLPCNPLKKIECVSRTAKLSTKINVSPEFRAWINAQNPIRTKRIPNFSIAIFRAAALVCYGHYSTDIYVDWINDSIVNNSDTSGASEFVQCDKMSPRKSPQSCSNSFQTLNYAKIQFEK